MSCHVRRALRCPVMGVWSMPRPPTCYRPDVTGLMCRRSRCGAGAAEVGFDSRVPFPLCPGERPGPRRAGAVRIGAPLEQEGDDVALAPAGGDAERRGLILLVECVEPSPLTASTGAPASSSAAITGRCPPVAASWSAVTPVSLLARARLGSRTSSASTRARSPSRAAFSRPSMWAATVGNRRVTCSRRSRAISSYPRSSAIVSSDSLKG